MSLQSLSCLFDIDIICLSFTLHNVHNKKVLVQHFTCGICSTRRQVGGNRGRRGTATTGRGRGRRGFGRGRGGRGGGGNKKVKTAEELDAELDEYNAKVCVKI